MSSEDKGKDAKEPDGTPARLALCAFVCGTIAYAFLYVLLFAKPMEHLDNPLAVFLLAIGVMCAVISLSTGIAYFMCPWISRMDYAEQCMQESGGKNTWPFRIFAWGLALILLSILLNTWYLIQLYSQLDTRDEFPSPTIVINLSATLGGYVCTIAGSFGAIIVLLKLKGRLGYSAHHMAAIGILAGTSVLLLSGFIAWEPAHRQFWLEAPNWSAAMGSLRTIAAAQVAYSNDTGEFARDLQALVKREPSCLTGDWDSVRYGYRFYLSGDGQTFALHATPIDPYRNEARHLFMDETLVIRVEEGAPASAESRSMSE
jgi:multisubunit Na+/H+ antiporter MnhB subunit